MVTPTATDEALTGRKARWRVQTPIPTEIRETLGDASVMVSHLLYCRGFRTADAIRGFFTGGIVSHNPFLLPSMAEAVERIASAVNESERVGIYGDFDCDGLTSAAVLMYTLQGLGLHPVARIPTRDDGHGMQPEGIAALADDGVTLLITADCGVTAIEEVRIAQGMGMDVIVTDHHEPRPDGSLPACPTVNARRHDSEYPYPFLCGVGVAYKLAQALREHIPGAPDPDFLLDLVALGTVADVVPLQDENRSLVIQGLDKLKGTQRPGLLALFEVAGVQAARIDPTSLGFYLAPRINAANRMASPQLAYDLITAADPDVAASLAKRLSAYNQQRQVLVAEKFEEIARQLGDPATVAEEVSGGRRPPLLVVVGDWPQGISGLLASRLVETYGLPAFVGADAGEGIVSVSARGTPGVQIDELLEHCEASEPGGLFLGYGGHARAGGFRVDGQRMSVARSILEEQGCRHIPIDEIGTELLIDAEVNLRSLTLPAARQIHALAPFGIGFPEPLFLSRGVTLRKMTPLSAGKHCRFSIQQGESRLDGVSFNVLPELLRVPAGSRLDMVFHVQLNEWQGMVRLELHLRDWRVLP
jgi:single-stranded-DNA-specific exonuclease